MSLKKQNKTKNNAKRHFPREDYVAVAVVVSWILSSPTYLYHQGA